MRTKIGALLIAALALLLPALPVHAEKIDALALLDAPLEFTADYTLAADGEHWRGTVTHAPGRERREFETALGGQAVIVRRDTDQAVVIWPRRKWYISTSLRALEGLVGGADGLELDRHREGSETVNGERCVRWRVAGGFTGEMWLTADGIVAKAIGIVRWQGKEMHIVTELAHIKRAAVDPDAFDPPADFFGVPVDLSGFAAGGG
jgi:hypothetical protein